MTPSIASLPRWYLEEQIQKFRNGQRGDHPDDLHGKQMKAAVSRLTEEQLSEALDHIDTLPPLVPPPTLTGDVKNGYELYFEKCMGCHRFNGHSERSFHSAALNGLQDWYLLEQMKKFQTGVRGYHLDDESEAKMRDTMKYLPSDQDQLDILALITKLANEYPVKKNPDPSEPGSSSRRLWANSLYP